MEPCRATERVPLRQMTNKSLGASDVRPYVASQVARILP
jgi:hypothetical protein